MLFHPELKSRIVKSHPLFRSFVAAIIDRIEQKNKNSDQKQKSKLYKSKMVN